ncbi:MAG: hypothetical protein KA175_13010 [Flavobacteriales bacterium]|nr:hypothetical protein [Flavobacteriales bacterium]MBP6698532.1 hypothetical protein [Flavobacteriales bacterium]
MSARYTPIHSFNGHRGPIYALARGLTGGSFLSGSGDGLVVEWHEDRPQDGAVLVNVGQAVFALGLMRQAELLFIGTEGGGLHVVDLASRKEIHLFEVHQKGVFRIVELPGGRMACAGGDGTLSVWGSVGTEREKVQGRRLKEEEMTGRANGPSGLPLSPSTSPLSPSFARVALQRQIPLCEEKLRDIALSADGGSIAVACGDGTVRILESNLFNELFTLSAHAGGSTSVAWHPGKPALVSGGKDGHIRLWRSDDAFTPSLAFPAHRGSIYTIAFSEEGHLCATASRDKTAKLWDASTFDAMGRSDRSMGGHTHSVNAAIWSGDALITAGDDKRILLWRAPDADHPLP